MLKLACPSCGAEVIFISAASFFSTCKYCQSMLLRTDIKLEDLGKMAMLQQDMSPLQIGTEGRYQNKNFTIIGRLKIRWSEGTWNEWNTFFDDGRQAWLAEAQGFYSFFFPATGIKKIPEYAATQTGDSLHFNNINYEVDDRRQVTIDGSEGELPFKAIKGQRSLRIDATGPGQLCASLDETNGERYLYLGQYVDFADMNFKRLRALDGWN